MEEDKLKAAARSLKYELNQWSDATRPHAVVGFNDVDQEIIVYMHVRRKVWCGMEPTATWEGFPVTWHWNVGRAVPL